MNKKHIVLFGTA